MIFYEILFGNYPGNGLNDYDRIKDIKKNKLSFPYNTHISDKTR